MCDDPVILTIDRPNKDKVNKFARETGNRFIATNYTGQSHNLGLYLLNDSLGEIFVIIGGGYFVNYRRVTKERFVDWIKDTHPSYFEWFLFHQEWL